MFAPTTGAGSSSDLQRPGAINLCNEAAILQQILRKYMGADTQALL